MPPSCITQEDRDGQAGRPGSTQDHAAKQPRLALAAYAGTTVSQVTHPVAARTRTLLGRDFLMVADTAWYGGPLLQDLHAPEGVEVLPPVPSSPNRQAEFDAVPLEQ